MKHKFTVYTDRGLPDSLKTSVQIAFTLTPVESRLSTWPSDPVACKTMRFQRRVENQNDWEWEPTFAFSKYEARTNGEGTWCCPVGESWPVSPGQSRTITNQRGIEWSPPEPDYNSITLSQASVIAANDSGTPQCIALHIRNHSDNLFDTIAAYHSVGHGEKIIAPGYLLLQAYVVSGEVRDCDILLAKDLRCPIFEEPLECDTLPASSAWRLSQNINGEIRLNKDDQFFDPGVQSIEDKIRELATTIIKMQTQMEESASSNLLEVTAIKESLSTTQRGVTALDRRFPLVETRMGELADRLNQTRTTIDESSATTHQRIGALELSLPSVEARFDKLSNSYHTGLSAVQDSLIKTQTQLSSVEASAVTSCQRLSGVEETANGFRSQLAELKDRRIPALEDKTQELGESTTHAQGRLQDYADEHLNLINARVISVESQLVELVQESSKAQMQQISELKESVREHRDRLGGLDHKIPAIEAKAEELAASFTNSSVHLSHLEKRSEATQGELSLMHKSVEHIQRELTQSMSTVGARTVADLEVSITSIEDRLAAVDKFVARAEKDIASDQQAVVDVRSQLSVIEESATRTRGDLATVHQTVTKFSEQLSPTEAKVERLVGSLGQTRDELSAVQSSLAKTNNHVSLVEASIDRTREQMSSTEESVLLAREQLLDLKDHRFPEIESRANNLEGLSRRADDRLSGLQNSSETASKQLDLFSHRIRSTEARADSLGESIEQNQTRLSTFQATSLDAQQNLEQSLIATRGQLLEFDSRFPAVESKIKGLATSFAQSQDRLVNIEKHASSSQEHFSQLQQSVNETQHDLLSTRKTLATAHTQLSDVLGRLPQVEVKTNEIESSFELVTRDLSTVRQSFTGIQVNFSRLEQSFHHAREELVTTIETSLTTASDQLLESINASPEVVPRFEELTTSFGLIQEGLSVLKGTTSAQLSLMDASISQTQADVTSLRQEVDKARHTISDIQESVATNHDQLRDVHRKLPTIESKVDESLAGCIQSQNRLSVVEKLASEVEESLSHLHQSTGETQKTLQQSLSEHRQRVSVIEVEVERVRTDFAGVEERFTLLEGLLTNCQETVASGQEATVDVWSRLSEIEELTGGMKGDLSGMQETLADFDGGLPAMETKLQELADTLGQTKNDVLVLEESLATGVGDISALHLTVPSIEAKIDKLASAYRDDLSATQESISSAQHQLLALKVSAETSHQHISGVEEVVNTTRDQLLELTDRRVIALEHKAVELGEASQTAEDRLESYASITRDHLARLDEYVTSFEARIAEMEESSDEKQEGLASVNKVVTDLRKHISKLEGTVGDQRGQLINLEKKLPMVESKSSELAASLIRSQDRLSSLEGRADSTQEELALMEKTCRDLNESIQLVSTNTEDALGDSLSKIDLRVISVEGLVARSQEGTVSSAQAIVDARGRLLALEESAARARNDLSTIQRTVATLDERFPLVEDRVGKLTESSSQTHKELSSIQSSLATAHNHLSLMEASVDRTEHQMSSVEKSVISINEQLVDLKDHRVPVIEATAKTLEGLARGTEDDLSGMRKSSERTSKQLDLLVHRIGSVEVKTNTLEESIEQDQSRLSRLQETTLETQRDLDQSLILAREQLLDLDSRVPAVESRVDELAISFAQSQAQLVELENHATDTQEHFSQLRQSITETQRNLSSTHETLAGTNTELSSILGRLPPLEVRADQTEASMKVINHDVSTLQKSFVGSQEKLSLMEQSLRHTREELLTTIDTSITTASIGTSPEAILRFEELTTSFGLMKEDISVLKGTTSSQLSLMNISINQAQGDLTSLYQETNEIQQTLLEMQQSDTANRDQLQDFGRRLPTIETKADELFSGFTQSQDRLSTVETLASNVKGELADLQRTTKDAQRNIEQSLSVHQKLPLIEHRIGLMEAGFATAEARVALLAETQQEMASGQQAIVDVWSQLSAIEKTADQTRNNLATVQNSLAETNVRLPAVELKAKGLESALGQVQKSASALEESLVLSVQRVPALDLSISSLEAKIGQLAGAYHDDLSAVQESLVTTRDRLSAIELSAEDRHQHLSEVEGTVIATRDQLLDLTGRQIPAIEDQVSELDEASNIVQEQLDGYADTTHKQHTRLDNSITSVETQVAQMRVLFEGRQEALASIEQAVLDLRGHVPTLERTISDNSKQLATLDSRIPLVESNFSEFADSFGRSQDRLSLLEGRANETRERLALMEETNGKTWRSLQESIDLANANTTRGPDISLAPIERRLASAEELLTHTREGVASNLQAMSHVQSQLSVIEETAARSEADLSTVQKTITALDERVPPMEAKLGELSGSFTQMHKEVSALQASFAASRDHISLVETSVEHTQDRVTSVEILVQDQLLDLKDNRIPRIELAAGALEEVTCRIQDHISELQSSSNLASDQLSLLGRTVQVTEAKVDAMSKSNEQGQSRFSTFQSTILGAQQSLEQSLIVTRDQLLDFGSRIPTVENRVEDLATSVTQSQGHLAAMGTYQDGLSLVQNAVSKLEKTMSEAQLPPERLPVLESHVEEAQQKIILIENLLSKPQEDLAAIVERTFQDSQAIRSTIESEIETKWTSVVHSALVSDIERRLSAFETKGSDMTEQLDSLEEFISGSATRDEMMAIQNSLRHAESHLDNLQKSSETAQELLESKVAHIPVVEAELTRLEESLLEGVSTIRGELGIATRDLFTKLGALDISVSETDTRLDTVERAQSESHTELSQNISLLDARVDHTQQKLNAVQQSADELADAIEAEVSKVVASVSDLQEERRNAQEELSVIIERVIHDSTEVHTTVENTIRDSEEIQALIREILLESLNGTGLRGSTSDEVATIQDTLHHTELHVSALQKSADSLREQLLDRIANVESDLTKPADLLEIVETKLSQGISSLDVRINDIQHELTLARQVSEESARGVNANVENMLASVSTFREQYNQHRQDLDVTIEKTIMCSQEIRKSIECTAHEMLLSDLIPRLSAAENKVTQISNSSSHRQRDVVSLQESFLALQDKLAVVEASTHSNQALLLDLEKDSTDSQSQISQLHTTLSGVKTSSESTQISLTEVCRTVGELPAVGPIMEKLDAACQDILILQGDLSSLKGSSNTADNRLSALDTTLHEIRSGVGNLEHGLTEITAKTGALAVSLNQTHNHMVESLTETREELSAALDDRLAPLEDVLSLTESRLDAIENSVLDTQSTFASHQKDLAGTRDKVEQVLSSPGGLHNGLRAVEEKVQSLEKSYQALSAAHTSLDDSVTTCRSDTIAVEGMIKDLSAATQESLSAHQTLTNNMQADLHATTNSLTTSVQSVEVVLGTLKTSIANTQKDIDSRILSIERSVGRREERPSSSANAPVAFQDRLLGIETQTSHTAGVLTLVQESIADAHEHLSQLSSDLERRLPALETKTSNLDASLARTDNRIATMEQLMIDSEEELEERHQAVVTVQTRLSAIERTTGVTSGNISDIQDSVLAIQSRVKTLDEVVPKVEGKLNKILETSSQTRDDVLDRLSSVEKTSGDNREQLLRLQQSTDDARSSMEKSILELDRRVPLLESKTAELEDCSARSEDRILLVEESIVQTGRASEHAMNVMRNQLSDMQESITLAETNLSSMEGAIDGYGHAIPQVEAKVEHLTNAVTEIQKDLSSTKDFFALTQNQTTTAGASSQQQLISILDNTRDQVDDINDRISAIETNAHILAASTSQSEERLNSVEQISKDHVSMLQKSIADTRKTLEESIDRSHSGLSTIRNAVDAAHNQISDLGLRLPIVEARTGDLQSSLVHTEDRMDSLEEFLDGVQVEITSSQQTVVSLRDHLSSVEDSVGADITTIRDSLASTQDRVAALDITLPTVMANVGRITATPGVSRADVSTLQDSLTVTRNQLAALETSVGETEHRLSDVDAFVHDSHDLLLEVIDHRVPAVEIKVKDLEESSRRSQGQLSNIQESVGVAQNRLDRLDRSMVSVGQKTGQLTDSVSQNESGLSVVRNDVAEVKRNVTRLERHADVAREQLAEFGRTVPAVESLTSDLTASFARSEERLSTVERSVAGTQDDISRLGQSLNDTQTSLSQLHTSVENTQTVFTSIQNSVDATSAQLGDVVQRLPLVEAKTDALVVSLETFTDVQQPLASKGPSWPSGPPSPEFSPQFGLPPLQTFLPSPLANSPAISEESDMWDGIVNPQPPGSRPTYPRGSPSDSSSLYLPQSSPESTASRPDFGRRFPSGSGPPRRGPRHATPSPPSSGGTSPDPGSPRTLASPLPAKSNPLMAPAEDSSPEPGPPRPLPGFLVARGLPLPQPDELTSPEPESPTELP